MKDARAALKALREEECERQRQEAKKAEQQRQYQMQEKLEVMRRKKQESLQYKRQLALQHMQEQERELHMRQEQAKQQYLTQQQRLGMASVVPRNYPAPYPVASLMQYGHTPMQGRYQMTTLQPQQRVVSAPPS